MTRKMGTTWQKWPNFRHERCENGGVQHHFGKQSSCYMHSRAYRLSHQSIAFADEKSRWNDRNRHQRTQFTNYQAVTDSSNFGRISSRCKVVWQISEAQRGCCQESLHFVKIRYGNHCDTRGFIPFSINSLMAACEIRWRGAWRQGVRPPAPIHSLCHNSP